ncbi:hypothetical protein MNBD_GAMMA23-2248 [hydrothermal vent metagenome]|uniref:SPOR domain-containing protein n=1 Tax=hydrothermal vent metagenome TaxID=652676 RepID=A0A3B0ZYZ9_9ZZZZ
MSRDYAKTPRPKHPNSIPSWAWLLAGLTIGLFVALLVYINDFTASSNKSAVKDAFSDIVNTTTDNVKQLKKQSTAITKQSDSKNTKPRFDFYTILPELEVTVPDEELQQTTSTKGSKKTQPIAPLMLQAGSFRKFDSADKLKATLALQGISAKIQTITKTNGDKWHRVQVGPIRDLNILNTTRHRLRKMGIASIVVKQKT